MSMEATSPVKAWLEREDSLLRVRLARPKANLVDAAMIAALRDTLAQYRRHSMLRGVVLDAEGPHFSFGASVEEHLPERCAAMLTSLHALIMDLLMFPVPVIAAVQGQCLGGGLEVALACGRIVAAPGAQFGQPEIKLGVFAPAASALLPYRLNQPTAEDLLLSGRSVGAEEALAIGLVQAVADDPVAAALAWFDQHLFAKSAAALSCALVGARGVMQRQVPERLAELERLYLDWLMRTHDAHEGLAAFLAKRTPAWTHQ
ncbi:crotonase/enoyl-CoA hydratase family protein [Ramlibacter solisilvae]|uniref:Cyclohexa-1,5-dienecarbonyl-CoA hydratase n=1 Tax=Ramlibacter tataouinensis TaxID=94132 RepID=A0A127JR84_9BURK|nr:cyclohexa-1,5-dienecarbonyl-CoA hydratase [Ramlibacter tataouinensis]AMO22490.1 cyclohexa-1,5-dienecarbonyl-CoA hydratase [Ramlibacter tataouinensis]